MRNLPGGVHGDVDPAAFEQAEVRAMQVGALVTGASANRKTFASQAGLPLSEHVTQILRTGTAKGYAGVADANESAPARCLGCYLADNRDRFHRQWSAARSLEWTSSDLLENGAETVRLWIQAPVPT